MGHEENAAMKQIGIGIVGTGWCGGIRAQACAASPLVKSLHLAEIKPERLAEVAKATGAKTGSSSASPTSRRSCQRHARDDALPHGTRPSAAGTFLEKPIAHDCGGRRAHRLSR
jgi:hypothetical protein